MQKGGLVMARRSSKNKRRRKKFTGINLLNAAEAYGQVSIWTQASMRVSPIEFIMGGSGGSSYAITLPELANTVFEGGRGGVAQNATQADNALEVIGYNLKNNWVDATLKSVLFSGSFAIGKKVTKKPRAAANKLLRDFGLGDLVRV